jgi:hypothetical protein
VSRSSGAWSCRGRCPDIYRPRSPRSRCRGRSMCRYPPRAASPPWHERPG